MNSLFLFLDLDGVIQFKAPGKPPEPGAIQLRNLRILTGAYDLPVVITSTWRIVHPLSWFRTHINPNVVGMTPELEDTGPGTRQREVEAWLRRHAPGAEWIALDDQEALYQPNCSNLILCHPDKGLDSATLARVIEYVEERLNRLTQSGCG
ncbi:HAD domain-containing protein [Hahella sp. SMD15-11]|uniref:HAD domain-containing protein n=1 Tax=Thermohahella caldifontis TaxID=3142973 RepID=A0AB39UTS1_9GAMM